VLATATTTILVVMMMVGMPVIVGMIMVVVATIRVVVAAPGLAPLLGLVAAPLPAGEDHEEKSGGEHENKNDERVHSDGVTTRTLGRVGGIVERAPGSAGVPPASFKKTKTRPASETLAFPGDRRRFSGVTTRNSPAIVER
jgi:hypothetical protein